jgi:hypothetical protein
LAKNNEKPKKKMNWEIEKKIYMNLCDSSGMTKTMTSNVISKNEMFSWSWNSITFLFDPHFDVFVWFKWMREI